MRISDWSSDVCSSDLSETAVDIAGIDVEELVDDADIVHGGSLAWRQRIRRQRGRLGRVLGLALAHELPPGGHRRGNAQCFVATGAVLAARSEAHTSELQSLIRQCYAVFCLKKQ